MTDGLNFLFITKNGASTPVPYEPVGVLEGPEPTDFSAQGFPGDTVHAQIPGMGTSHHPWQDALLSWLQKPFSLPFFTPHPWFVFLKSPPSISNNLEFAMHLLIDHTPGKAP